jgi:N6-adenosine-specific RNA methylase IME4
MATKPQYNLIYCDPAWQYKDQCHSGQRGAGYKYTLMELDAIKNLPVASIAAPDCLLALWWVPPMPLEALAVVEAWGFTLKTMCGFTWHKTTKNGHNHFGMGNWTRANAENCLFAVRGKPKRANAGVSQIITAPVGRHSEKPAEARLRLERLMGDVPRIELFARTAAPGWDVWGNEIESTIDFGAINYLSNMPLFNTEA